MATQIAPVLDRLGYAVQNGPRMRVLFASGIDGFCHRYAVLHWAEQLATQAIASTVRAHTDPRLAADLATHDVLVLYRVPDGAWVRHLLAHARALGVATVFAVDCSRATRSSPRRRPSLPPDATSAARHICTAAVSPSASSRSVPRHAAIATTRPAGRRTGAPSGSDISAAPRRTTTTSRRSPACCARSWSGILRSRSWWPVP